MPVPMFLIMEIGSLHATSVNGLASMFISKLAKDILMLPWAPKFHWAPYLPQLRQTFSLTAPYAYWSYPILKHPYLSRQSPLLGHIFTFHDGCPPLTTHIHLSWHIFAFYDTYLPFHCTYSPFHDIYLPSTTNKLPSSPQTHLSRHDPPFMPHICLSRILYPPLTAHNRLSWQTQRHTSAFHDTYLSLTTNKFAFSGTNPPFMAHICLHNTYICLSRYTYSFHGTYSPFTTNKFAFYSI